MSSMCSAGYTASKYNTLEEATGRRSKPSDINGNGCAERGGTFIGVSSDNRDVGRYHPGKHDSFIKCDAPRCGANNAPEGSAEYDTECWRCGKSLGGKPEPGDEVTVDIVDEKSDGTLVCKTESGFVLFLEEDISAIQATVRVTSVDETYGEAELVETGP